jgi:heat shock protein HslJ
LAIAGVNFGYKISAAETLNYSHSSIQPPVIHDDSASGVLKFPANQRATQLGGTSWQLVKFQGGDDTSLMPDDKSKYTITFGKDGRVSARIDCNRGSGAWKSSGSNQLQFGPIALTRAMCPPGSLHDQISKNWTFVRSYIIKDGHLFLSLMADGGVYEFEPVGGSQPLTSLFGKRWRLTEVKGTAVRTSKPYIEFDAKSKRFSGDGGCNSISGGFEVDGMHIRFSRSMSTQRACIDSEMQQVETDFFKGLTEATDFQIQGEVLRMYAGNRPILTFRADTNETSGSPQAARVTGTVTYRQRIALSPKAVA